MTRFFYALLCVATVLFILPTSLLAKMPFHDGQIVQKTATANIEVHYPILGQEKLDDDILKWAQVLVEYFQNSIEEEAEPVAPYELKATYTTMRASDRVFTVVWNVMSYTGGAHGNLEIVTANYDTSTETPIELQDIFGDLDTALTIMSQRSRHALSSTLGNMLNDDMLTSGTTEDIDNFSCFALTPDGIRIFFPPYQVAPWAAGSQTVDIPLSAFDKSMVDLRFWGKKQ